MSAKTIYISRLTLAIATLVTLTSCGNSQYDRYSPEAFDSAELTGGVDTTGNARVYTRGSNGSDHALLLAKEASDPKSVDDKKLASRVASIEVKNSREKNKNQMAIKVVLENPSQEFVFVGKEPKPNKGPVNFKSPASEMALKLFCSDNECDTFVGVFSSGKAALAFTSRTIFAKARLRFIETEAAFELLAKYSPFYPAFPIFMKQFSNSTAINAWTSEVAMGRSVFKIELSLDGHNAICLEGDLQNTDLTGMPLPQIKITCGLGILPVRKVELVGNTQNGQIAVRFEFVDNKTPVDLYVDLNGKDIDNKSSRSKPVMNYGPSPKLAPIPQPNTTPPAKPQPEKELPAPTSTSRAFISVNLNLARTSELYEQFRLDWPSNGPGGSPVPEGDPQPEETYGQEITKKWIMRWQGAKISIPLCFTKDSAEIKYNPTISRFFEFSKKHFVKIKSLFEKFDVPANFFLTTLVESPGYFKPNPMIEVSASGAVGPWQFMPSTGKEFGLKTFPLVNGRPDTQDERTDFMKSSAAAIKHFSYLLKYFETDYKLAFAAYNSGAAGLYYYIRNVINPDKYDKYFKDNLSDIPKLKKPYSSRQRITDKFSTIDVAQANDWWELAERLGDQAPDYWFLHEFHMMSCETRNYVPKLISAMMINEDPKSFGF